MKPKIDSNVQFRGKVTTFYFSTNKQTAANNRYRSIERAAPMLKRFGYLLKQNIHVIPFFGYLHVLHMRPWKKEVEPASAYGRHGINIGTMVVMRKDPIAPITKVGDNLWYTPPVDVKHQLPDERFEGFSFPGMDDGSIDFDVYGKPTMYPRVSQRGTHIYIGG